MSLSPLEQLIRADFAVEPDKPQISALAKLLPEPAQIRLLDMASWAITICAFGSRTLNRDQQEAFVNYFNPRYTSYEALEAEITPPEKFPLRRLRRDIQTVHDQVRVVNELKVPKISPEDIERANVAVGNFLNNSHHPERIPLVTTAINASAVLKVVFNEPATDIPLLRRSWEVAKKILPFLRFTLPSQESIANLPRPLRSAITNSSSQIARKILYPKRQPVPSTRPDITTHPGYLPGMPGEDGLRAWGRGRPAPMEGGFGDHPADKV